MNAGRPLRYKTNEELQKAIDIYFKDCKGKPLIDEESGTAITDKNGNAIMINAHPPTVTGLALALGFSTRQSLINYQGRKQFLDTVTRAKSKCEEYAESRLFDRDGAMGAKFSLSNNFKGWHDHPIEDDRDTLEHLDNILKALNESMKQNDDET